MSDEIDNLRAQIRDLKEQLYGKNTYISRLEEHLNVQETPSRLAALPSRIPTLNRLTPGRIHYKQLPSSSEAVTPFNHSPQADHRSSLSGKQLS